MDNSLIAMTLRKITLVCVRRCTFREDFIANAFEHIGQMWARKKINITGFLVIKIDTKVLNTICFYLTFYPWMNNQMPI